MMRLRNASVMASVRLATCAGYLAHPCELKDVGSQTKKDNQSIVSEDDVQKGVCVSDLVLACIIVMSSVIAGSLKNAQ